MGALREAIIDFSEAIKLKPDLAEAFFRRAGALEDLSGSLIKEGRIPQARESRLSAFNDLSRALSVAPVGWDLLPKAYGALQRRMDLLAPRWFGGAEQFPGLEGSLLLEWALKAGLLAPEEASNLSCDAALLDAHVLSSDDQGYLLDKGVHDNPECAQAYFLRGIHRLETDDYIGATEDLSQAAKLSPERWEFYYMRASANFYLNRISSTLSDVQSALERNPRSPYPYYLRSAVTINTDQPRALDDCTAALQMSERFLYAWQTYGNRALLRENVGDHHGALADLTKAIELNQWQSSLYVRRAELLIDSGDPQMALRDCLTATRINPRDPRGHYSLGRAFEDAGLNAQAIEAFVRAADLIWEYMHIYGLNGIDDLRFAGIASKACSLAGMHHRSSVQFWRGMYLKVTQPSHRAEVIKLIGADCAPDLLGLRCAGCRNDMMKVLTTLVETSEVDSELCTALVLQCFVRTHSRHRHVCSFERQGQFLGGATHAVHQYALTALHSLRTGMAMENPSVSELYDWIIEVVNKARNSWTPEEVIWAATTVETWLDEDRDRMATGEQEVYRLLLGSLKKAGTITFIEQLKRVMTAITQADWKVPAINLRPYQKALQYTLQFLEETGALSSISDVFDCIVILLSLPKDVTVAKEALDKTGIPRLPAWTGGILGFLPETLRAKLFGHSAPYTEASTSHLRSNLRGKNLSRFVDLSEDDTGNLLVVEISGSESIRPSSRVCEKGGERWRAALQDEETAEEALRALRLQTSAWDEAHARSVFKSLVGNFSLQDRCLAFLRNRGNQTHALTKLRHEDQELYALLKEHIKRRWDEARRRVRQLITEIFVGVREGERVAISICPWTTPDFPVTLFSRSTGACPVLVPNASFLALSRGEQTFQGFPSRIYYTPPPESDLGQTCFAKHRRRRQPQALELKELFQEGVAADVADFLAHHRQSAFYLQSKVRNADVGMNDESFPITMSLLNDFSSLRCSPLVVAWPCEAGRISWHRERFEGWIRTCLTSGAHYVLAPARKLYLSLCSSKDPNACEDPKESIILSFESFHAHLDRGLDPISAYASTLSESGDAGPELILWVGGCYTDKRPGRMGRPN